ncbi:MAG: NAD(P)-binding protein, partial [Bacteroidota bacterium]
MAKAKKTALKDPTFIRKSGLYGGGLKLFRAITSKEVDFPSTGEGIEIPRPIGRNKHIVILGGGLAGLTCAYEFLKEEKTQHQVTILEATKRVGGRSLTLRPGDSFTEKIGRSYYTQTCEFEHEIGEPYPPYLNAGPGRIPSAHRNVLNYCKALDVELQVYIMQTRSNRLYSNTTFDGKQPAKAVNWQNRRIANDTRGFIAQYLYDRVDTIAGFTEEQKEELRSLLTTFGKLNAITPIPPGIYTGSSRSGYTELPNVESPGKIIQPIPFKELLNSAFWKLAFYQPEDFLWQETSFQPVGGMDMIEKAFERE